MIRRFSFLCLPCVLAFAACVGDDPAPQPAASGTPDGGGPESGALDGGALDDGGAGTDAAPRRCETTTAFTKIEPVEELNEAGLQNYGARLTGDGLTVYFHRTLALDDIRIYTASRSSRQSRFSAPVMIDGLATPDGFLDSYPAPTPDGSLLFFQRRFGTAGDTDVWSAVRKTGATFEAPAKVANLDSTTRFERTPYIGGNGSIWLGVQDADLDSSVPVIRIAQAAKSGTGYEAPKVYDLGAPPARGDESPVISRDGLTLYFQSSRSGAGAIWVTTRSGPDGSFAPASAVAELNLDGTNNLPSYLTDDACELYLHRMVAGVFEIYRASR